MAQRTVEDWHAGACSRISDPELARATVAVTRRVRTVISDTDARRPSARVFSGIADAVGDLNGLLPDGRAVGELAGSPDERRSFVKHVRAAERRWNLLAADLGPETVLRMLACSAGWRARHWWGTPWWPARRPVRFPCRADGRHRRSMDRSGASAP